MSLASRVAAASRDARTTFYVSWNALFSLGVFVAALAGPGLNPRPLYLGLLMAICSTPLLWLRQLNGRFVLLSVFLLAYFYFYGAADLVALFAEHVSTGASGLLSLAEITILAAALMAVGGYRLALGLHSTRDPAPVARDYPPSLVIGAGLVLWIAGMAGVWWWQVHFQNDAVTLNEGINSNAILLGVLARMLEPLGAVMLAYGLAVTRSRLLLLVVIGLLAAQAMVGFIGDSKETAMRGVIILIMAAFLIDGRIARGWITVLVAFAVLVFPIFQAYRAEVMHVRGMSRADAASDILRSIKLAMGARDKVERSFNEDYKVPSFIERTALKPTLELFIDKTGVKAPFQDGHTLGLYFTGFVPRFIWPDKPAASIGQLMNREFRVSEDPNTYISTTFLGEFYWNFGYAGALLGMLGYGFLLGFINARCDLSERRTLTRLLVLVTVIYISIVRFEGSLALQYILLTRSLILIGLMHLLFARVPVSGREAAGREAAAAPAPLIHAPQLLR